MYLIYCAICFIFLLAIISEAFNVSNANIMLRIILCYGFLFIFLEFLHAQTSSDFAKEIHFLSGILGIISCILTFATLICMSYYYFYDSIILFIHNIAFYIPLFYMSCVFVFSLQRNEAKFSTLFKCSILGFALLWYLFTMPILIGGAYNNKLEELVILELLVIFGCTQLIPLKSGQTSTNVTKNPLEKFVLYISYKLNCTENSIHYGYNLQTKSFLMIKGMFMLILRFMFFIFLATRVAIIWS
jgi:hypothetical protein